VVAVQVPLIESPLVRTGAQVAVVVVHLVQVDRQPQIKVLRVDSPGIGMDLIQ
jgi:hypothetical protein